MPLLCSALAWPTSSMMAVTRSTALSTPSMLAPDWRTSSLPSAMPLMLVWMSVRISLAAAPLRWASARTSDATTANPRPASPARAASTAAFSARMLVWKAMPSITATISPICRDDSLIWLIFSTARRTACPLACAVREASPTWLLAWRVWLAFCWAELSSSVTAAEASCSPSTCSCVRSVSSRFGAASASPVSARLRALSRTWATSVCSWSRMVRMASSRSAVSSRPLTSMGTFRRPAAISPATRAE